MSLPKKYPSFGEGQEVGSLYFFFFGIFWNLYASVSRA